MFRLKMQNTGANLGIFICWIVKWWDNLKTDWLKNEWLIKRQVDKMNSLQKEQLTKRTVDKRNSWQNEQLTEWRADEMMV